MIPSNIKTLLSEIIIRLAQIPRLTTAVLYGSAVRDELTETSDIDLMLIFDVKHNPETGGELEKALSILGQIETKRKIQIVAHNLKQTMDPDFFDNIVREGIIIYGKPLVVTPEKTRLKPYIIFAYSVAGLPQVRKSSFQRAMYGYSVTKKLKKKTYKSEDVGALKMLDGKKLGKGVVLLPQENAKDFEGTLKRYKVKYIKHKVWC